MGAEFRGPSHGYLSDAKEQYRHDVWAAFSDEAVNACINDEDTYALILPSKEGLEIPHLIARGIPEHKIICIDESAALIATSAWRKKYPKCKFYAAKASEVSHRLAKDGRNIGCANLDLCNNFSDELIYEVTEFVLSVPKGQHFNVAVTIARGRESTAINTLLSMVAGSSYCGAEEKRCAALYTAIYRASYDSHRFVRVFAEGKYIHNKFPMVWFVFGVLAKNWRLDSFDRVKESVKQLDDAIDYIDAKYPQKRRETNLHLYRDDLSHDDYYLLIDKLWRFKNDSKIAVCELTSLVSYSGAEHCVLNNENYNELHYKLKNNYEKDVDEYIGIHKILVNCRQRPGKDDVIEAVKGSVHEVRRRLG